VEQKSQHSVLLLITGREEYAYSELIGRKVTSTAVEQDNVFV